MTPLAKLTTLAESAAFDFAPVGDAFTHGDARGVIKNIGLLEQALRNRAHEIEEGLHRQAAIYRDQGDEVGALQAELKLMSRASRIRGAYIGVIKRQAEAAQAALLDRAINPQRKIAQALDALEKVTRSKKAKEVKA